MKRQAGMMILEIWYSNSRCRQGIIQPSTTRRRILMRRITLATGEYFLVLHYFLSFSSCNLTTCCPHVCYRRDGVCMPSTSDHERFFHGYNADTTNRDGGRPNRASGNTHCMDQRTPGAEAHLNRYNTRGSWFQGRHYRADSPADGHNQDSSDSELSSSSSPEWSVSPEHHSRTPTLHVTETQAEALVILTVLPHQDI